MVSLCRAEDLPSPSSSSSETFSKLLGTLEGEADRKWNSAIMEGGGGRRRGELTAEEEMENEVWSSTTANCTTPTAKQYKIPQLLTCPPAPMKRKRSRLPSVSVKQQQQHYFHLVTNLEDIFKEVSSTVK